MSDDIIDITPHPPGETCWFRYPGPGPVAHSLHGCRSCDQPDRVVVTSPVAGVAVGDPRLVQTASGTWYRVPGVLPRGGWLVPLLLRPEQMTRLQPG